jgi:hypothetical protein
LSLLWIQAAWHNAKPGTEEWDEHGFGHESREQRRDRYVQHVQDTHGVDRDTALHALQHVTRHLRDDAAPQVLATDYGFASAPHFAHDHPETGIVDSISASRWRRAPVRDVPLGTTPVHASQWFITPRNVAHNLFHSGKRPTSYDEEEHGHPDIEPERWSREDLDYAKEDERESGPTNATRLIRQTDGSLLAVDGHHRLATDLLLRKPTTRARVIDIRDLGGKRRPPEAPPERPQSTGKHRTDIPHEPGMLPGKCLGC